MHHPGTSDAAVIERLFAGCNLHPRVAAYSDDFNASLQLASVGLGAALVPELALQNRPENVVVLDVPEIRLARNIFALLINDKRTARGWSCLWTRLAEPHHCQEAHRHQPCGCPNRASTQP